MTTKTGQCMCGAVKFTARDLRPDFGACHCDMCRRWSGGRWMGVHVRLDQLTIEGEAAIRVVKSSPWAERAFCGTCGSSLWYCQSAPGARDAVSLSVGLLDETGDMHLAREFYVDRKSAAFEPASDCTQLTEAEVMAMFAPKDATRA